MKIAGYQAERDNPLDRWEASNGHESITRNAVFENNDIVFFIDCFYF